MNVIDSALTVAPMSGDECPDDERVSDDPRRQRQMYMSPEPNTRAWVGRELDVHVFASGPRARR